MNLFEKTVHFDTSHIDNEGWIYGKITGYSYKFIPWEWIKGKWKAWRSNEVSGTMTLDCPSLNKYLLWEKDPEINSEIEEENHDKKF